MYISLGVAAVVRKCDIVGIFDLDNTTVSRRTRILLSQMQQAGRVRDACEVGTLPKSMILTACGKEKHLWLSQYSPQTLARRMEYAVAPAPTVYQERKIRVGTTQKDR
ncbi:MAG: DUF370 domain-containing protein [Clostridia bacterium]|nr:DUF370 domain-containing protein [Clostridia bacterium]